MADLRKRVLGFVMAVVLLIVLIVGSTDEVVHASELDYLGLELGATWVYAVTHLEKSGGITAEETCKMERQVVAVDVDVQQGMTTYTIRENWIDKNGNHNEYKVTKTSSGRYFVADEDELRLVFEAPLDKGSKSNFSIGLWEEWDITIWGQVNRETPLGNRDAWLAKAWDESEDGSYAELTIEFIPYVGFLQEAKLERIFPDGCS